MTNNTPLISIIVPVYNVEKYIKRCIDSILCQTYSNFELILVDDGSLDNSGKICDEYRLKDSRVKVFHKSNGGVSSARNLGLNNVNGDWITFIDADDWIGENFIYNLYMPILEDTEIDFVHGGCSKYRDGKVVGIEQKYDYYLGDDPVFVFNNFRGLAFSKLFRREIIVNFNLSLDEKMKIAEDMAFTLDYLLYVKKYCFVSDVSYFYCYNSESLTNSCSIKPYRTALFEHQHIYLSVLCYINKYNISTADAEFRLIQRANVLVSVITILYSNKMPMKERLKHLKNDFSLDEINLLPNAQISLVKKIIFYLLKMRFYILFDFVMNSIYKNR